jgi:hypothetical protein
MNELKHWRRSLRDGGVEFYFSDGKTHARGSVTPSGAADEIQSCFEKVTGVVLPAPTWKTGSEHVGR